MVPFKAFYGMLRYLNIAFILYKDWLLVAFGIMALGLMKARYIYLHIYNILYLYLHNER